MYKALASNIIGLTALVSACFPLDASGQQLPVFPYEWRGTYSTSSDSYRPRLELILSGNQGDVTGKDLTSSPGDVTGTIRGSSISFTTIYDPPGRSRTYLEFKGQITSDGKKISGKWIDPKDRRDHGEFFLELVKSPSPEEVAKSKAAEPTAQVPSAAQAQTITADQAWLSSPVEREKEEQARSRWLCFRTQQDCLAWAGIATQILHHDNCVVRNHLPDEERWLSAPARMALFYFKNDPPPAPPNVSFCAAANMSEPACFLTGPGCDEALMLTQAVGFGWPFEGPIEIAPAEGMLSQPR